MKNPLLATIIIAQIALIIFLVTSFSKKQERELGLGPRLDNSFAYAENSELKYFKEPLTTNPNLDNQLSFVGYIPKIYHNKDTLNERREYSLRKSPGTTRIATIGDSWTYGFLVDTDKNYSEVLESSLNEKCNRKIEVINIGAPEHDLEYTVERFKRRGLKYNPDYVLWFIHENDMSEVNEILLGLIEKNLEGIDVWSMDTKKRYETLLQNWHISRAQHDEIMTKDKLREHNIEQLRLIRGLYEGHLILFSVGNVVALPDSNLELLRSFAENNSKTDFYPEIVTFDEENELLPDGHPNEIGHQKIASKLEQIMSEYVSC